MTTPDGTITRDDLENKLREIEDITIGEEGTPRGRATVIVAAVVVTAIIAYSIWRRQRRRIKVEVFYQ